MARKTRLCALVVDDNSDVAESFARVLLAMGCEAAAVTDARSALDEAIRLRPHIAFLDLGMPHVNGYALARALRKHFTPEQLRLVAVTGYNTGRDRDPRLVEAIIKTALPDD